MIHKFCQTCGLIYDVEDDATITECVECHNPLETLSEDQMKELGIIDEEIDEEHNAEEEINAEPPVEDDENDYLNTNKDGYYDSKLPQIEEEIEKSRKKMTIALAGTVVILVIILIVIVKLLLAFS